MVGRYLTYHYPSYESNRKIYIKLQQFKAFVDKNQRDFIIQNKKHGILCNTVNVFQTSFPFYATQIVNPFLNSQISANSVKCTYLDPFEVKKFEKQPKQLISFDLTNGAYNCNTVAPPDRQN